MYQIVIQLKDMSRNYGEKIHEIQSPHFVSIQEAFESISDGKEMFESYLACEQEVMKSINEILSKKDEINA